MTVMVKWPVIFVFEKEGNFYLKCSDPEEQSRGICKKVNTVNIRREWGAGGRKEESVTLVTILMCFKGRRGEKREKGKSQSHQPQILMCFESRKERQRQEPVTSVMILMQPMAVAYMKLDNHAGSKGCPFLIYRTSHEPTPMSQIQGLPGAPPLDPWLHPNISFGCTTSQS